MSVSPIEAHLGLQAGDLQSGDLTLYLCSPLMEALPLSYMCAFGKLVCERFLTAFSPELWHFLSCCPLAHVCLPPVSLLLRAAVSACFDRGVSVVLPQPCAIIVWGNVYLTGGPMPDVYHLIHHNLLFSSFKAVLPHIGFVCSCVSVG